MEPYLERLTQVPESEPEMTEARERMQQRQHNKAFGQRYCDHLSAHALLLAELEQCNNTTAAGLEERAPLEQEVARSEAALDTELRNIFSNLAVDLQQPALMDKQLLSSIDDELHTLLNVPQYREELALHFGTNLEELSVARFCNALLADTLSLNCLDAILRNRADHLEQLAVRAEDEVHAIGQALARVIEEQVADGQLPEEAVLALHRLRTTQVRVTDALTDPHSTVKGSHEGFGTIYISSSLLRPTERNTLEATIVHELLHELAGTSTDLSRVVDPTGEQQSPYVPFERKSGLAIYPRSKGTNPRFHWLNEAVTEWLTYELLPLIHEHHEEDQSVPQKAYVYQRSKLSELMAQGVDARLFLNAYFENIQKDTPGTGEHFGALMKRIREVGGEHTVARLENEFTLAHVTSVMQSLQAFSVDAATLLTWLDVATPISEIRVRIGTTKDTEVRETYMFMPTKNRADMLQSILDSYLQEFSHRYGGKATYEVHNVKVAHDQQAA